jgi:hypothetical protein
MRSGVVLGFRLANFNHERGIWQFRIINMSREDADMKGVVVLGLGRFVDTLSCWRTIELGLGGGRT